jgi:K+-transporting ATPase ATPase C chain
MKKNLVVSVRLTIVTAILFGVVYPFIVTGIAWVAGPNNGKGETIPVHEEVRGFTVIGQSFTSDKYFNSRPSAVGYNAAATGGSNKGPSNPDYLAQVEERITDFLAHNPTVKREEIPVDLVTASGGGLDPHISVKAAQVQIARIAATRGIEATAV